MAQRLNILKGNAFQVIVPTQHNLCQNSSQFLCRNEQTDNKFDTEF
jgi:hypothetical protein